MPTQMDAHAVPAAHPGWAANPVGQELERVLRTGPFDRALWLAIRARGLSLERLHMRLCGRGISVSMASLSYWQRGRCRPERAESLRAVHALEEILELPPDSLVALLGPRRNREPAEPGFLSFAAISPVRAQLNAVALRNGYSGDDKLEWLSCHETLKVGRNRDHQRISTKVVFRATAPDVSRYVTFYYSESGTLPDIRIARYCQLGDIHSDEAAGLTAMELVFDHPLAEGETYLLEFEFGHSGLGELNDHWWRGLRTPVREYLLNIEFHPAVTPRRCFRTWQANGAAPPRDLHELRMSTPNSAHFIGLDLAPGVHGIRWEWE